MKKLVLLFVLLISSSLFAKEMRKDLLSIVCTCSGSMAPDHLKCAKLLSDGEVVEYLSIEHNSMSACLEAMSKEESTFKAQRKLYASLEIPTTKRVMSASCACGGGMNNVLECSLSVLDISNGSYSTVTFTMPAGSMTQCNEKAEKVRKELTVPLS